MGLGVNSCCKSERIADNFQLITSLNLVYLHFQSLLKVIQLHDLKFKPFLSAQEIQTAIDAMASKIQADHAEHTPVFLGILNGSFMVVSDLLKAYTGQCEVSFVKLASYEGTSTTHEVKQLLGLNQDLKGRHVVVVEDIVDTGNTVEEIVKLLADSGAASVKIATLFLKPEAYHKSITIDYVALEIPNKFIVGFGLDYNGLGRNLPEVYQLAD